MIMQGTVIGCQMNVDLTAQNGNSYKGYRLMLETNGKVETIQKPMQSVKFKPQVANALKQLKPGDFISVVMEKNKAGYNEVENITIGQGGGGELAMEDYQHATQPTQGKQYNAPAKAANTGRDFETKEERAEKQKMIVRQSSLAQAVAYAPKSKPEELLATADMFYDWVMHGGNVPASPPDITDDIPF